MQIPSTLRASLGRYQSIEVDVDVVYYSCLLTCLPTCLLAYLSEIIIFFQLNEGRVGDGERESDSDPWISSDLVFVYPLWISLVFESVFCGLAFNVPALICFALLLFAPSNDLRDLFWNGKVSWLAG